MKIWNSVLLLQAALGYQPGWNSPTGLLSTTSSCYSSTQCGSGQYCYSCSHCASTPGCVISVNCQANPGAGDCAPIGNCYRNNDAIEGSCSGVNSATAGTSCISHSQCGQGMYCASCSACYGAPSCQAGCSANSNGATCATLTNCYTYNNAIDGTCPTNTAFGYPYSSSYPNSYGYSYGSSYSSPYSYGSSYSYGSPYSSGGSYGNSGFSYAYGYGQNGYGLVNSNPCATAYCPYGTICTPAPANYAGSYGQNYGYSYGQSYNYGQSYLGQNYICQPNYNYNPGGCVGVICQPGQYCMPNPYFVPYCSGFGCQASHTCVGNGYYGYSGSSSSYSNGYSG